MVPPPTLTATSSQDAHVLWFRPQGNSFSPSAVRQAQWGTGAVVLTTDGGTSRAPDPEAVTPQQGLCSPSELTARGGKRGTGKKFRSWETELHQQSVLCALGGASADAGGCRDGVVGRQRTAIYIGKAGSVRD